MSKSNIMVWLSRREEKKILNLCKNHLDKTVETVKGMARVVHSFCDEDFNALEEHYQKTFNSEREADEIKRQILQDLSKGPLHPIDREELIRLVLTADDIAENAKSGARKLRLTSKETITNDIKINLKEMANRCVEIVEKVRTAFGALSEGVDVAIKEANEVEMLEENIDEFHIGIIKLVLTYGDKTKKIASWLMLLNAIENMEEVADHSEDVADVIRIIAILG
jgi:predicted phosphate transport protein (TIGR00153 family)